MLLNKNVKYLYFIGGCGVCIVLYHILVFNSLSIDSYLNSFDSGNGGNSNGELSNYSIHIDHHHWAFILCFFIEK